MKVYYKKIDENAKLPQQGTPGSAGFDVYALGDYTIFPNTKPTMLKTGIAYAVEPGYFMAFYPRSGMSAKTKLRQPNCVGIIDEDYRGEVKGLLENIGDQPLHIQNHDRIGQIIFQKYETPDFIEVEDLPKTTRGAGGFGSTGK